MTTPAISPEDTPEGRLAAARQAVLTKPPGSLGRLEELAIRLAGIQGVELPTASPAAAVIFASDHPVARHGVSAYPAEVTGQMMENFAAGGAASTVMARAQAVPLTVVDVGVASPYTPSRTVRRHPVAEAPVGDLREARAMPRETLELAMAAGADAVDDLDGARVLVLGEMGIGNTTAAAAVAAALLDSDAAALVGPGTGVTGAAFEHKIEVVDEALDHFRNAQGHATRDARTVLAALGGRELAALAGALLAAPKRRLPVLVDGFIVSAAALAAVAIEPSVAQVLVFSHCSAEQGHRRILDALGARPLLDLDLRLGEATGALTALPLLDLACRTHAEMATFSEAGIAGPAES